MNRATLRLARATRERQRGTWWHAKRTAGSVGQTIRRGWLFVQQLLADGRMHAAQSAVQRFGALALMTIATRLTQIVKYTRQKTARNLVSAVPRRQLAHAAERRMRWQLRLRPQWIGEALEVMQADEEEDYAGILFPPLRDDWIEHIVYSTGWAARLANQLAPSASLASVITQGLVLGRTHQEVASDLLPFVGGVEVAARRIARTEAMRVAQAVQMDTYSDLGDLVIGYQVHALLDERTRPEHRARSGTIYWAHPQPNQFGYADMPHPPHESDGSLAWNCRCYLTPVLRDE